MSPHHCLSASPRSADLSGRVVAEKPPCHRLPWEEAVVSKIRTMTVSERCRMLQSILCCLQQDGQVGAEFHPLPRGGGLPLHPLPWRGSLCTLCPGEGGPSAPSTLGACLCTLLPRGLCTLHPGGLPLYPPPWGASSLPSAPGGSPSLLCPGASEPIPPTAVLTSLTPGACSGEGFQRQEGVVMGTREGRVGACQLSEGPAPSGTWIHSLLPLGPWGLPRTELCWCPSEDTGDAVLRPPARVSG